MLLIIWIWLESWNGMMWRNAKRKINDRTNNRGFSPANVHIFFLLEFMHVFSSRFPTANHFSQFLLFNLSVEAEICCKSAENLRALESVTRNPSQTRIFLVVWGLYMHAKVATWATSAHIISKLWRLASCIILV